MKNISLSKLKSKKEDSRFERKSARIQPKDIIKHVIAFANADGGLLVIGIEDDGKLTGTNYPGAQSFDDYKREINQKIKNLPEIEYQRLEFSENNVSDNLYLICVGQAVEQVCSDMNENVYLRIGDTSLKQNYKQIQQLEFAKGERTFEDSLVPNADFSELDKEIVEEYKNHLKSTHLTDQQVLKARGFIKDDCLTVAGALMFLKNPSLYFPQARLRFLRYDGIKKETGKRMNIVKDQTFEGPLPRIIRESTAAITAQLREFQSLGENGIFQIVPEYPEFAWYEGIVNALVHRDYSMSGDYVRVSMYDDRLEIFSPGALPSIVTLENMRYTRYSRNPRIARALTDFGWVRELNEGVNRIYDEMEEFYLEPPEYIEPNSFALQLNLYNNYESRQLRTDDRLDKLEKQLEQGEFNVNQRKILSYLYSNETITVKETMELLDVTRNTAKNNLSYLLKQGLVKWIGSTKHDPSQYYARNFD